MSDVGGQRKVPVMVLSGFLGSGKTTFLRHLVSQQSENEKERAMRVAVIQNEFGEAIGIEKVRFEIFLLDIFSLSYK